MAKTHIKPKLLWKIMTVILGFIVGFLVIFNTFFLSQVLPHGGF